ncbi:MAG: peptidoglycan DD-metalloendopeptidase family protein [Chloroflexota bacterium]
MTYRPTRRLQHRLHAAMVFAIVLAVLAPIPGLGLGSAMAAGVATVVHASDGVNLRSEPAYGASIITTLAEGATVTLRNDQIDPVLDPDGTTRWWPVTSDAGDGWIAGFYLDVDGTPAPEEPSAPASDQAITAYEQSQDIADAGDWGPGGKEFAVVTEPDGVNLRAEPGLSATALGVVPSGETVTVRSDIAETVWVDGIRWWPISSTVGDGWVASNYLSNSSDARDSIAETSGVLVEAQPASSDNQEEYGPGHGQAPLPLNSWAEVATTGGEGLNIRADGAPDAERVGHAPEGDVVQVMEGPQLDPLGNPWYLITDGEISGWVFGDYLIPASQPDSPDGTSAIADDSPLSPTDIGIATGSFIYPLISFRFTQAFGCTGMWLEPWDSNLGCNFHNGIDLAAPMWSPVEAADGGIVEQAGWCDCGFGYYVKIDHGNGFKTLYGHLAEYYVTPGQAVEQGDLIAALGSTGNSTGPHLHFTIQLAGTAYDPLWYLE